MSLKTKLMSSISMFCLTIAMLLVGVWAVSSTSIEIGGKITFTATNVNAKVSGSITGSSAGTITPTTLEYSSSTSPSTTALNAWKNDLSFDENGTAIVYTITIQNLSSERSLYASISDTAGSITNLTKTTDFTDGQEVEIGVSSSKTFTITFGVGTADLSIDGNYSYSVELKDESEYVPPVVLDENKYANGITYTLDDSTMTASITGYDGSCNSNVIIPGYVIFGGNTYNVERIDALVDGDMISSYFYGATHVKILEGVKTLGGYCFIEWDTANSEHGKSTLESISLPNSLVSIEGYALAYGGSPEITIPDGATVASDAFYMASIGNLTIGRNVTFSAASFSYTGIDSLTVASDVPDNFLAEQYLGKLTLKEGVASIGVCAFQDGIFKEISIPSSVTNIGNSAFKSDEQTVEEEDDCGFLTTVIIDSEAVASGLTSATAQGYLIHSATTIYIKEGLSIGSYVESNYSLQTTSDKDGYVMYTK